MDNISQTVQQKFSSKQVFQSLKEMRTRLETINKAKTEPIAIVGFGCRFPGDVNDSSSYWRLLHNGVDAVTKIPLQRWDVDEYYDPEASGKIYTKEGGFIDHVDQFDPLFFGISPREAFYLDPQQRLLLEVTWEALENAGQAWSKLRNSNTGVFIGISTDDYAELSARHQNQSFVDAYSSAGILRCMGTGRISHLLGLQGPNIQLDTACSTSLVSIHLACQSLRLGECSLALAGGVNLLLSPMSTIGRCQLKALSPDGRCKTFDASANGYGQGEGCGVVVLKRLSNAVADGDLIWALIRGSAINHDGPSNGLTVPNGIAQEKVIKEALTNARLKPNQVNYVEAHGTGTSLGDPIEIEALAEIYGEDRAVEHPLLIGSVKTNIGHLEAAAGIAGLIKVVLQLQHQQIAPHLHFNNPSPHVAWDELSVKVPTSITPWPRVGQSRFAGISSFGMSGTNAHVVLEEAPPQVKTDNDMERPTHLLTLSAKTEKALAALITRYHHHLTAHPDLDLADVCYTANTGRAHFNHRLAVVASSPQQLVQQLLQHQAGEEIAGLALGQLASGRSPVKVAFLFTGQGSQYLGMGRQLYETQPIFRQALEQCSEILHSELEHPLLEVLYPETENESSALIDQTVYTQAALFALEYALAQLWQSWGVKPDGVMGHSVGEYVAATVAGVFSLEEGLKLIAARGRLMQQLPAEDSESSEGSMEPMLAEFEAVALQISYQPPRIPLISNVTGVRADERIATARYWVGHVRQAVQFAQGMETLREEGYGIFLEIGPRPILLGKGQKCLTEGGLWLASLRPGMEEWQQMLVSLGQLYVQGVKVDWSGFDGGYGRQKVGLPTYPFQRQRYWITDIQDRKKVVCQVSESQKTQANENRMPEQLKTQLTNLHSQPLEQTASIEKTSKRKLAPLVAKFKQIQFPPLTEEDIETPNRAASLGSSTNKIKMEAKLELDNVDNTKLKETLKQQLADALYIDISEIEEDQKFVDLGLDSIVGVEWITNINELYGLGLKATKLYEYPTLQSLAEYLAQELSQIVGEESALHDEKPTQEEYGLNHQNQQLRPDVSPQIHLSNLKKVLKQQLADALYIDISEIEEDQKFVDLGLDSIVGVEWITNINQLYRLELKATKLYEYPTLQSLAEYLAQQLSYTEDKKLSSQENEDAVPDDSSKIYPLLPVLPEPQENLRKGLRIILSQVANNELTVQEASQIIKQMK